MRWPLRASAAFAVFAALYAGLILLAPHSALRPAAGAGTLLTGIWVAVYFVRWISRRLLWRLRNRLLVTYLFIAAAPIVMVVWLATLAGNSLVHQLAAYLVTSELDRRSAILEAAADGVAQLTPEVRAAEMPRVLAVFGSQFPGLEALLRQSGRRFYYPEAATTPDPPLGWEASAGLMRREGRFYLWSHRVLPGRAELTLTVPLTRQYLAGLAPAIGLVDIGSGGGLRGALPPAANRFDIPLVWFATKPAALWDMPGASSDSLIAVRTRVSAVLGAVFNDSADQAQGALKLLLALGLAVFTLVEITCGIIGISMTRTVTGAVHRLYEGTQKVMEGDFSHRIEVADNGAEPGGDQLAELSHSFNRMTAHVEQLLVVAKEKERLESEIEIARQVQSQLFPRATPHSSSLRLAAFCQPARMVSGDYYDYTGAGAGRIAIAIGDVAGKGISAALLMAALQSSLRAQLQDFIDAKETVPTSRIVARMNRQLYDSTAPEKFASFFLGIYDEASSTLNYTNAGHVPPVIIRRHSPNDGSGSGRVQELDGNGTVVGMFPSAEYTESCVKLDPGDLLVCFTDGASEPENPFGEEFGEQRLAQGIAAHADLPEDRIIATVHNQVREWTGSQDLPDDFTLLLARRVG